jgi:hypothetical protein
MELTSTVRAAPSSSSTPRVPQGGTSQPGGGIRPLATATPDESAAADPEQRASSDQARRNPDTLTVCDALDLLLKPPVTKISETLTPIQKRPPSTRRPLHIPSRTQTPSAHPR